jgi:hypothetical protein
MAVVAAIAIAAGVGYALYENNKASRSEEVKVREAAADAAARQLAQDEKAAADKETSRKAAADRETAQKAAADRGEARKAAADRKAAQKAAADGEAARKAAADLEAAQAAQKKAYAAREALGRVLAQQVASSTPHVTVRSTNCVGAGPGLYTVTVSGDAQAPPAETYGLYAEIELSTNGIRLRPACGGWAPAQQTDGGLWRVSCVHRPNDSTQTTFVVTGSVYTTNGKPPSEGGIGTWKFDKKEKGPFTSFSLNCP